MLAYSIKTYLFPYFNHEIEVRVGYGLYSDNDSLAVVLMCRDADIDDELPDDERGDYDESDFNEVFGTITVNLKTSISLQTGEQFIDINNYPLIARWLIENDLATPTEKTEMSGHILYPVYKFQVPKNYTKRLETLRL